MKKHLEPKYGYIKFKRFEINYSIYEWALPFSIDFTEYLIFMRFFCVSVIINKTKYDNLQ